MPFIVWVAPALPTRLPKAEAVMYWPWVWALLFHCADWVAAKLGGWVLVAKVTGVPEKLTLPPLTSVSLSVVLMELELY